MVRGNASGWARVIDRVGSFFRRLLLNEPCWEVTAQLTNGTQVIRYSLIGCANDVRAGGGLLPGFDFRFVPGENVTSQIEQILPDPARTVPAETPTPAPATPVTAVPAGCGESGGSGLPQNPVAPVAQPATEPKPVVTVVEPTTPTAPPKPAFEPDTIKFELRKATDGKGAMAKFTGVDESEDLTFETEPGVVTIRFRPKQM